ncbi:MAG: hypothetical protein ACRDA4_04220 [Filifactoraceae bacterium]
MTKIVKSNLKLAFVVGTDGGKDIVKNKSISSMLPSLTDEVVGNFAKLVIAVSLYPATAQRIDVKELV